MEGGMNVTLMALATLARSDVEKFWTVTIYDCDASWLGFLASDGTISRERYGAAPFHRDDAKQIATRINENTELVGYRARPHLAKKRNRPVRHERERER
jgi:hypothetical protein